ncbi:MAG: hypothetical protein ACRC46_04045 [Thermoguttaceae bacterium]
MKTESAMANRNHLAGAVVTSLVVLFAAVVAVRAEQVITVTESDLHRIVADEVARQTAALEAARPVPPPPQGIKKGKLTITPYGYFNLSASYNSQRAGVGDYVLWSNSPDNGKGAELFLDPKSTRLGLKVAGPPVQNLCNATVGGTVEIDFQQPAYVNRNRGGVMLRQAYVEVVGKENRFLVGQTWDVVAPLVPAQLAYVPGGTTNLGYRRAQIRFEKNRTDATGRGWIAQFALTDNVVMDNMDAGVGLTSTGAMNGMGWPQLQGRVAKKFPGVSRDLPVVIGLSGHIGEYQRKTLTQRFVPTWSGVVDVDIPFHTKWRISSELATGQCLSTLLGSAMIGYDTVNDRAVRANVAWLSLTYQATKTDRFGVGYCIEDMPDARIDRTRNQIGFANWLHNWTDSLLTGLEFSYYETDWLNTTTGRALSPGRTARIETIFRYTF